MKGPFFLEGYYFCSYVADSDEVISTEEVGSGFDVLSEQGRPLLGGLLPFMMKKASLAHQRQSVVKSL